MPDRLLAHYEAHPDFITPEKYRNEIVAFVKRGPERSVDQPHDLRLGHSGSASPQTNAHVMYVWVDALTNYITATGYLTGEGDRAHFWPADAHVIGKDITRFHAIYWPAFLMSARRRRCPSRSSCMAFCSIAGEKMSKSVGNVIDPHRSGRALWRRSVALFLPARSPVRPGRQLLA